MHSHDVSYHPCRTERGLAGAFASRYSTIVAAAELAGHHVRHAGNGDELCVQPVLIRS